MAFGHVQSISMRFLHARRFFPTIIALMFVVLNVSVVAENARREIPRPLPSHPGNIFLAGEPVTVPAPPGDASTWRMMDYSNNVIAKGNIKDGRVELGQLPVGFYKIVRGA